MKTEKILNYFFYFSVLVFFIGFNFRDTSQGGWYLQTMPDLNGRSISDITFADSLVGYATAFIGNDTNYALKTTNGGNNWFYIYRDLSLMRRIQFLNTNTGYLCGSYLKKTTNGGINWIHINTSGISAENMWVHNEDTIWIILSESMTGGVFRTTNGGQNWTQQLSAGNQNPDKIYMFNTRIGFIVNNTWGVKSLRKTTDSGNSWFNILNEGFSDMKFIDSLTGWKCWRADTINKTTNGGLNWINYLLPPTSGNFGSSVIIKIAIINNDTIWGAGPEKYHTQNGSSGMLYITTNGGLNWGYQLPDISIYRYYLIDFESKKIGWAYSFYSGVHTVTGGDTTIYVGVNTISNEVPGEYNLFQNYPNPFNSITNVKFQMLSAGQVTINVYDLSGKEIRILVNEYKQAGTYSVSFNAEELSSGVYFYRMQTNNFTQVKKMILIK